MRPSLMSTTMTRHDSVPKSKPSEYFAITGGILRLAAADMKEVAHQPRVANVRLALGQLLTRIGLIHPLDRKAAVDDQVHPSAERAMKPWHAEFRQAFPRVRRRRAENPFLDLPVH